MLKRYIIFAFDYHDAEGGWNDVVEEPIDETGKRRTRSFDTVEEARSAAESLASFLFWQVVDLHTGKIVAER